jgi:ABC-type polysaccharide/polyol phosphate export permease
VVNLNKQKKFVHKNLRQIFAITEKNIFLQLRYKSTLVSRFLNPLLQLIVMIFIFGTIFSIRADYNIGYWNAQNYVLFLLLAFSLQFIRSIIKRFEVLFTQEKFWKTLSAVMVAPLNRYILLLGTLISELIFLSIPLLFVFFLTFIFFPISFFNVILVFIVFFLIVITLGSIGLLLGIFSISYETMIPYTEVILRLIFIFSCINYSIGIFPEIIQNIILFNPFYYLFDMLRLTWYLGVNFEAAIALITPIHIIVLLSFSILLPIISVSIFKRIYKKFGITGY